MKKYFAVLGVILAVAAFAGIYYVSFIDKAPAEPTAPPVTAQSAAFDGKNSTFEVAGKMVTLASGVSEVADVPGSAAKTTTRYFGNAALGDLTGDGLPDVAFLVTQNTGGTGTFFYAVVAVKTATGYKTTNAFLLGDRIAPQTTEINESAEELYVNYATRKPGEPMTARPSQGVTQLLMVNPDGSLTGLKGKL